MYKFDTKPIVSTNYTVYTNKRKSHYLISTKIARYATRICKPTNEETMVKTTCKQKKQINETK